MGHYAAEMLGTTPNPNSNCGPKYRLHNGKPITQDDYIRLVHPQLDYSLNPNAATIVAHQARQQIVHFLWNTLPAVPASECPKPPELSDNEELRGKRIYQGQTVDWHEYLAMRCQERHDRYRDDVAFSIGGYSRNVAARAAHRDLDWFYWMKSPLPQS